MHVIEILKSFNIVYFLHIFFQHKVDTTSSPPPPPPPGTLVPNPMDPRHMDIVKATQYGVFDRVRELIESGYDVNHMDHEDVSLLHWAAINNRTDIVKYYIFLSFSIVCEHSSINIEFIVYTVNTLQLFQHNLILKLKITYYQE